VFALTLFEVLTRQTS